MAKCSSKIHKSQTWICSSFRIVIIATLAMTKLQFDDGNSIGEIFNSLNSSGLRLYWSYLLIFSISQTMVYPHEVPLSPTSRYMPSSRPTW
jgi:hypothetical protein